MLEDKELSRTSKHCTLEKRERREDRRRKNCTVSDPLCDCCVTLAYVHQYCCTEWHCVGHVPLFEPFGTLTANYTIDITDCLKSPYRDHPISRYGYTYSIYKLQRAALRSIGPHYKQLSPSSQSGGMGVSVTTTIGYLLSSVTSGVSGNDVCCEEACNRRWELPIGLQNIAVPYPAQLPVQTA